MRFFAVALLLLAALVAAGPHPVRSHDCDESGAPVPTPTGDSGDSGSTPSPSAPLESYAARGLQTSNAARGLPTSNDPVRPSSSNNDDGRPGRSRPLQASFVPIAMYLSVI
jgi:hypothetical protein